MPTHASTPTGLLMHVRRIRSGLILVVAFVLAACTHGQTPGSSRASGPSPAFRATDANGDGRIDRAEYHQRMMDNFFLQDADKDGYLTANELSHATPEAIGAADGDSDGKLSAQEYVNERFKEFEAADRNRDGALSHEEVDVYDGFGPFR
jgi:hypothetical protein